MKAYAFTTAAELDLIEIFERISLDSPRNARKVVEKIHSAAQKLADMPTMGHLRKDITNKLVRFWPVYSWLIVYRPDQRPLEILRIVHGMRDLARELRNSL